MKRKGWILLLAILFTLNLLGIAAADTSDNPWEIPEENPNVVIGRDAKMPVFNAGEKIKLKIPIENTSNTDAKDISVSISAGDAGSFPFSIDEMSITEYAGHLAAKSRNIITFDLNVPATAKPKTYPINVTVNYKTYYGYSGSASDVINVKIENPNKQPNIYVTGVDLPGENLPSGQSSLVKIQVKNNCDLKLKNLEFKLSGFNTNTINLDKWPDAQYIGQLSQGGTAAVEYRLYTDAKLEKGTYPLDLGIKYLDEYGQEYTQESVVYLPVSGKGGADDEYTPRLIIDNYYFPGEYMQPGLAFPLSISFYNASATTAVGNIKVSINSDGDVFSPVGSSNSFYIDKLEAGGRIEKNITLKPKNDAENGNYNISVDLQYQDSAGTQYNEKELISIPVNQNIILVVTDVETPDEAFVGIPTAISIDFYNTGRSVIRNLIVKAEGDFEIQDGNAYLGNLEAGKENYFDVTIIPQKEGVAEGKIILQYEDNIGQPFMVEKSFQINAIMQQPSMEGSDMMPEEQPAAKPWLKWLIVAGGIILLAVIAVIVIRRRRRRLSEELEFDE
ncbi:MAG TPA: hypothetical protein PKN87_10430 [Syntrophomonadaceae bacterium]|nr:hypothetical protein [Syntrophomonadaceae bacterium]HPR94322.1 hypothetical protein [Syntrophomonadaceae bacterium]